MLAHDSQWASWRAGAEQHCTSRSSTVVGCPSGCDLLERPQGDPVQGAGSAPQGYPARRGPWSGQNPHSKSHCRRGWRPFLSGLFPDCLASQRTLHAGMACRQSNCILLWRPDCSSFQTSFYRVTSTASDKSRPAAVLLMPPCFVCYT